MTGFPALVAVPVTFTAYRLGATFAPTVYVNVAVEPLTTTFESKDAEMPVGNPVTVSVTGRLEPFVIAVLTAEVPLPPCRTDGAVAASEKSPLPPMTAWIARQSAVSFDHVA
jgi:hypothetical protein